MGRGNAPPQQRRFGDRFWGQVTRRRRACPHLFLADGPSRARPSALPRSRIDVQRPLALVAPDDAPVDPADEPRTHRALDVERRVVRGDAQRCVDVPERVRVVGSLRGRGSGRSGRSSPRASCGSRSRSRADRCRGTERESSGPAGRCAACHRRRERAEEIDVLVRDSGSTSCPGRSGRRRCAGRRGRTARRDRQARNDVRGRRGSLPAESRRTRSPRRDPPMSGQSRRQVAQERPPGFPQLLPRARRTPDSKERLELEEVGPDLLDDLGEVGPANEPHARLGRRRDERHWIRAVARDSRS